MTEIEFQKMLEKYSPFKIKGESQETYTFKGGALYVNGIKSGNYLLQKRQDQDNSFNIVEPGAIIPLWKNVKIDIGLDNEFPIIINYDEQALSQDSYRHKDAINGFFILESLNPTAQ